jgi:hypothetical protein
MKRYCFLLMPLFAVLYSSCTKLNNGGPAPDPLQGLLLTDTLTMYTGNVVKLHVTVTPSSYDTTKLVWKSSDTSVISVTNSGVIKAKNEGTSQISLSNVAQTKSVSCLVTVKDSLKVGLLAYYPFNNSTNDVSGHNFNGTAVDLTSTADRHGKSNSAYYFNGLTSYVTVADNPVLRLYNTSITLNAWVKLDDYNSSFGDNILSKHFTGADQGWAWGITGYAYSPIGILTYGPGGGSASARGAIIVNTSQWHMVTSVYDLTTQQIKLYVDGVLDNVTNGIPSPNGTIAAQMCIGRDNPEVPTNGYFVKGAIDEVRIYGRKLNISEIHKLFVAAN